MTRREGSNAVAASQRRGGWWPPRSVQAGVEPSESDQSGSATVPVVSFPPKTTMRLRGTS